MSKEHERAAFNDGFQQALTLVQNVINTRGESHTKMIETLKTPPVILTVSTAKVDPQQEAALRAYKMQTIKAQLFELNELAQNITACLQEIEAKNVKVH